MSQVATATAPIVKGTKETKLRPLNAEQATAIAVDFLRRLGNKRRLKPKSATLQNGIYVVEVELKKATAKIQIDFNTREIKEYSMEPKTEETPTFSINFKSILLMVIVSAAMYIVLSFMNVQSFF